MTKNTKALLRIRPLEYFFFGGESTFGNGDGANYFARSNPFPQQTTVLGLLRRLLFDAQKPIGNSFQSRPEKKGMQDFGVIVGLSPVFLMDGEGTGWLPHALDSHSPTQDGCKSKGFAQFGFSTTRGMGEALTGLGENPGWTAAPYFEDADSKRSLTDLFVSQNGDTCKRTRESKAKPVEVFETFTRIGITKFRRGADPKTRVDAFYKQEMFKLAEGWSFAVEVELEAGFDANFFTGKKVVLGGEKCLARLETVQNGLSFESIFQPKIMYKKRPAGQVVLISDALVGDDFFEKCTAVVAETTPFRNIITPIQPKNYGPMKDAHHPDFLSKTGKMTLLKSGSVLYGNTQNITDELDNQPHFHQIGYNHYLTF